MISVSDSQLSLIAAQVSSTECMPALSVPGRRPGRFGPGLGRLPGVPAGGSGARPRRRANAGAMVTAYGPGADPPAAAAWLRDIGYSPGLADGRRRVTPRLDGARQLRPQAGTRPGLAQSRQRSGAPAGAAGRGTAGALAAESRPRPPPGPTRSPTAT